MMAKKYKERRIWSPHEIYLYFKFFSPPVNMSLQGKGYLWSTKKQEKNRALKERIVNILRSRMAVRSSYCSICMGS